MDGLCGNNEKYKEIREWINKTYENKEKIKIESCLFVSGVNGIGKSYSINKICEELELSIINIDSSNCNSSQQLNDIILQNSSSLLYLLSNNKKKKIILIDEFETLISIDRTINITLLNILLTNKIKNIPIICICNPSILKKIGDIKKKCKIINLEPPSNDELIELVNKLKLEDNIRKIKKIIKTVNGNISQLLKKVEYVEYYNDIDVVNTVEYLYGNKFDRNILYNIISLDSWLIPLRFHENLIKELDNRKISLLQKKKFYKTFLNDFILFDRLMYTNNTEIACDYFINLVYNLKLLPIKKNNISNMENFTKILSYLSLQKKYIKQSYISNYPLYQIGNYHVNMLNRNFIYLK